jgi:hypothetical protein
MCLLSRKSRRKARKFGIFRGGSFYMRRVRFCLTLHKLQRYN